MQNWMLKPRTFHKLQWKFIVHNQKAKVLNFVFSTSSFLKGFLTSNNLDIAFFDTIGLFFG
jgi:hypothetical protein